MQARTTQSWLDLWFDVIWVSVMQQTQNLHVRETIRLLPPRALKEALPMTERSNETVVGSREAIKRILRKEDPRLLVVIGPCSIHDVNGGLEYAQRLNRLREELSDQLCLVMRVYFEKPRTTIGWKGFINDPRLDETFDMNEGLRLARKLLLEINEAGV